MDVDFAFEWRFTRSVSAILCTAEEYSTLAFYYYI